MAIRALTFDLDDTLWSVWPVIALAERRLHEWLAEHCPLIVQAYQPEELRNLCRDVAVRQPHLEHDKSALRMGALRLAAERTGCDPSLAERAFAVFYAARQEVELFADVLPVLETLKNRYPLGALSNGNASVRLVGLDHLFDFHISAVDAGAAKPNAVMFNMACQRFGLEPSQVVHVGDDPESDIRGAGRAGLRTIWVNRGSNEWPDPRIAPDATVTNLYELESLLVEWGS